MSPDIPTPSQSQNCDALPQHPDEATLETISNRWPEADFEVNIVCEEFTCICPITSQADYAQIHVSYSPKECLVEAKSLKYYLASYRNVATFHEFAINKICHDLAKILLPKKIEVRGEFTSRGGIRIVPVARWRECIELN